MAEKKLVFATNNLQKLEEVRAILGKDFTIFSLKESGCDTDIPETGGSFQENASIKARYVYDRFGLDCFADDSGLEVEALGGIPGIHSARYSGEHGNDVANIAKLLAELKDEKKRADTFRTEGSLIMGGNEHFFDGIVNGIIQIGCESCWGKRGR